MSDENSNVPSNSPFFDHVVHVLNAHGQALDIGTKSELWDAFAQSRDSQTLAAKLSESRFSHVPNSVKHELYIAHEALKIAQTHVDRVIAAAYHIAAMNPRHREIAESHPHVLRQITSDKE